MRHRSLFFAHTFRSNWILKNYLIIVRYWIHTTYNRPVVRGSARSAMADPKFEPHCTVADPKIDIGQFWPTLNFRTADPT